ncbi:MAG: response regulator [Pseudomonadota bacterium]
MSSILVADDDEHVLDVIAEMLRMAGHDVTTALNGIEVEQRFRDEEIDLVITDIVMPEQEGLETINNIRQSAEHLPIIAISGGGRVGPGSYLDLARRFGANAALHKPFELDDLVSTVTDLLGTAGVQ